MRGFSMSWRRQRAGGTGWRGRGSALAIRKDARSVLHDGGGGPCDSTGSLRTCVRMTIVCILLERFELAVAAGGRAGLLGSPRRWRPSRAASCSSVTSRWLPRRRIDAGMRMGEALRAARAWRCPPDPMGVAEAWERGLSRLENLGAAVESLRPGEACFDARGLERLHAGRVVRMLADGYLAAQGDERLRRVLAGPRVGQGPTRFCAMVAASAARVRRPAKVAGAADLALHPVALLRRRATPPRSSSRSSGWGSRHSARSRRCRAARSPTASAAPACWPTTSPAGRTRRWRRACPASCCARSSGCPSRARASSWAARSGCSSTACSRAASGAGARCAPWCSRRGSSRAARGASASSFARRSPTASGCAWCSAIAWRCCPPRPRRSS